MFIGTGISPFALRRNISGASYGAYTTAWYAQVLSNGGTATPTELSALTTFETAVGSDLAEFDRLGIMGLQNQIAARTSFVNPTSTMLSLLNSPTFTAGEGFTGNGVNMALNTNFNISTGTKFTRDSSSMGVYIRTVTSGVVTDIGAVNGVNFFTQIFTNRTGVLAEGYINSGGSSTNGTVATSRGLTSSVRDGANVTKLYRNGSLIGTNGAVASQPLISLNMYLLARNSSGSVNIPTSNQQSAYFIGSGLINQSNFYTALQALGTTLGWAV